MKKMLEYAAKDVTSVWKGRLLTELSTTPLIVEQMRTTIDAKEIEIRTKEQELKQVRLNLKASTLLHKQELKQMRVNLKASTLHLKHDLKKKEQVRNRMIMEMDRMQREMPTAVQKDVQKIMDKTKKQKKVQKAVQKNVQKIMKKTKKPVQK